MTREIGSEFWDVSPMGKEDNGVFPESTRWFLSGRLALRSIIKQLVDCRTVAVPSWCCESMIEPFVTAGLEVCFYPVYWRDGLVQKIREDCDVLFLIDYFGYVGDHSNLSSYQGVVVRDITHSVFSSTYSDADYYFGSLRKWSGFWTGGYAWTRDGRLLDCRDSNDCGYVELRKRAMSLKEKYVNGEENVGKKYLVMFDDAEELLDRADDGLADKRDVRLACQFDAKTMRFKRRANAAVLREAIPDWLIFSEMRSFDCPMFVPVRVPNEKRNDLRSFLIEHEIYCPIHWTESEFHKLDDQTRDLYDVELSLVCDQRYDEEDMLRMVEMINLFQKAL